MIQHTIFTSHKYLPQACPTNLRKNLEKWDWSAGLFTRVFSDEFGDKINLDTLDSNKEHLRRCKVILGDNAKNVNFIKSTSEDYLKSTDKKYDIIYNKHTDCTEYYDNIIKYNC